jgi:5'-nucleotidase
LASFDDSDKKHISKIQGVFRSKKNVKSPTPTSGLKSPTPAAAANSTTLRVSSWKHLEITRSMPEDAKVVALLKELEAEIQKNMTKVIGRLALPFDVRFKAIRTSETNAANFVADCIRGGILPHPDVVLINSGTLRTDGLVPQGNYTVGDLLTMLPMMDPLIVIELTGAQLIAALENGVSQWPALEGRFPCVSGVSFAFDTTKPPGSRVVRDSVKLGGQLLGLPLRDVEDNGLYTLCTKEYLSTGKDGYTMFPGCRVVCDSEDLPQLSIAVRQNFSVRMLLDKFRMIENHTVRGAIRRLKELRFLRKHKDEGGVHSPTSPTGRDAAAVHTWIEGRIRQINGEMVCPPPTE